mgnify:CR=1 FL=1
MCSSDLLIEQGLLDFDTELATIVDLERSKSSSSIASKALRNVVAGSCNSGSAAGATPNCCCYVNDPRVRLRFLRSERFNPQKAAQRYFQSLSVLHEYFGDDALKRQLYISDLTTEEIRYLKNKGEFQLMNSTDSVGRRIYFVFFAASHYSLLRIKRRIHVFLLHSVVAEDVVAQRKGIVFVGSPDPLPASNSSASSSQLMASAGRGGNPASEMDIHVKSFREIIKGLPVNISATHLCFPNEQRFEAFVAVLLVVLGEDARARSISHTNSGSSIMQMMYTLQNFGIFDFPLTHTGTIKTKNVKDFVKARTAIDSFRRERSKQTKSGTGTIAFTTDE